MRIVRLLGWLLLVVGLGILAWDLLPVATAESAPELSALGDIWFALHPNSLQLLQPAIERHVSPVLWDPFVLALLTWPASVEAIVLGALLLLVGRRRRR